MWKIADFGLTREGTSTGNKRTEHSKGTASYRAPELNQGDYGTWNNKVDIWALGCVLFELITGHRAFRNDIDIGVYRAQLQNSDWLDIRSPTWTNIALDSRSKAILGSMLDAMLSATSWERPKIAQLLGVTNTLYGFSTPIWLSKCRHTGQALPGTGITLSGHVLSGIAGSKSLPLSFLSKVVPLFPGGVQHPPDRTLALNFNSPLWIKVVWKAHWYTQFWYNH